MPQVTQETTAFPRYAFSSSCWEDFQSGVRREWLITNGIGGFASSSVIGANTRSYHGLLIAAMQPPVDRQVLWSKVEEEVTVGGSTYQLSTNQYRDKLHPSGYHHLASFTQNPFPTWTYSVGGVILRKWLFMRGGENTTVLGYEVLEAPQPIDLYLLILVTKRNFHHILRADPKKFDQEKGDRTVTLSSAGTGGSAPFLHFRASKGSYFRNGEWYYNFQYVREKERGHDFEEDLFHPGTFSIKLAPGEKMYLACSTRPIESLDGEAWESREEARLRGALTRLPIDDPDASKLAMAADSYVVSRNGGKSVIAGYPWFNDWGRDTFISIPGLLLVTGRADEAKQILREAVRHMKNGSVATNFPDTNGVSPSYDSVDASLWFIYAVYKTWEYSGDKDFLAEMSPSILSIVDSYRQGGKQSVKTGADGLLYASHPENPLTWMDAKVGHWVVTPRNGAAVEVNALWHNALKVAEILSSDYSQLASKTASSFAAKFWNPAEDSLYDVIGNDVADASVRPNQIFAVSLPFRILPKEKEEKVFRKVATRLYTPYGLRTLSPDDKNYKGIYQGDRWLRDGAYHQGTVWPWLLGPFMTAMARVEGEVAAPKIRRLLSPIMAHLSDAGIGHVSEIFWGDFPHLPAGCIAQAWSLAEILRAYVEDGLGVNKSLTNHSL